MLDGERERSGIVTVRSNTVTILSVSGITLNDFTFGSCLPARFPAGHPSWDCSESSKLNFRVPNYHEAIALLKRVVTH